MAKFIEVQNYNIPRGENSQVNLQSKVGNSKAQGCNKTAIQEHYQIQG